MCRVLRWLGTLKGMMEGKRALRSLILNTLKGINPFTGEETVFKAKPARKVVKIRPLKKVKDMVG